jgi:hypothetical protein
MEMTRREELLNVFEGDLDKQRTLTSLVDDIVFIEDKILKLRQYPFIVVNPSNPLQQKQLPAFKQYKELLQQYSNLIKMFMSFAGHNVESNTNESLIGNFMDSFNDFMKKVDNDC